MFCNWCTIFLPIINISLLRVGLSHKMPTYKVCGCRLTKSGSIQVMWIFLQSLIFVFCFSVIVIFLFFTGLFSWGSSWFSSPPTASAPSREDSPAHPASTLTSSSDSLTTETFTSSETHTLIPSSSSPEVSSKEPWITVQMETTTKLADKRAETVTSRASGRGGRGRGKKHRGEDRSRGEDRRRGEERGKAEEEGSGEITGAEAKGEIQVSRRPADSKPRERSRERSRERGHRKGQSTTTTTTTATGPLVTTETTTTGTEDDSSTARDQTTLSATENSSLSTPQETIQTLSSSPSLTSSPPPSISSSPSAESLLESQPAHPSPSHASTSSFSPPSSSSSPSYSQIPTLTPSLPPTSSHSTTETQTTGLVPSLQANVKDNSNDSLASLPFVLEEKVNGSLEYPLSLLGPQDDEESAWSHAVGSGTILPDVLDEDSVRGEGGNISTTTVSPTGKHESDFRH